MKAWGISAAAVLILIFAAVPYGCSTAVRAAEPGLVVQAAEPTAPVTDGKPVAPAAPPVSAAKPSTPDPPALAQSPAVPAPGEWSRATALEAAVNSAMASFPGRYSVAVADLDSGQRWVTGADQRYHPASTIKMVVSLYALEQYRAGKLSWQHRITYTAADFESPGGGSLEEAPFGSQYSVEELVTRALRDSNNIAVNMLGRYLGWNNIRAWSRSIHAELYRTPDGMPEVTVLSELGWWLHLDHLTRTDPAAADMLLTPLRAVTYHGRIPEGLPAGVAVLHKFGSYDGNYHDSGIIYAARPYVLIVLTSGATEDEADSAIAKVSAKVYQVLGK